MARDRVVGTMGTRAGRVLVAALLTLTPASLAAQYGQYGQPAPQPRPEVPRDTGNSGDAPAAAAQAEILRAASCLVGRDAAAASALLATSPYSSQERQTAVRTLRSAERCLDTRGRLATSPLLLRGAVAESLYEAQFAQPVTAASPARAAAALLSAEAAAERADVAPAFALADCTAARHPDLVRSLIAAEPETDGEGTALQALTAVFGECVTPGSTLNVDRAGIRAMLAESLYRWSVVQRDGASSPWAAAVPVQSN